MAAERDPIREAYRQWQQHGWGGAAEGMAMVTSVVRAHQLLMERIDAVLRPLDLSFARYEALRLLAFTTTGTMPMTRLGSLLQVHPTSVTSAVNRLVGQGYAERLRREDDRRVILAAITPTGRQVVEEATKQLNAKVFEQPGLTASQVTDLTALLTALRAAAGDLVTDPQPTA